MLTYLIPQRLRALALFCLLLLIAGVLPAQAAIIDLSPIAGEVGKYLSAILDAVLFVGMIVIGKKLHDKWGIEISDSMKKTIADLVRNQANALIEKGAVKVAGLQIDIKSEALARAANTAIAAAPLATKALGLTPEKVGEMIKAQVPQTPAVAAEVATTVTPGSESITIAGGAPAAPAK